NSPSPRPLESTPRVDPSTRGVTSTPRLPWVLVLLSTPQFELTLESTRDPSSRLLETTLDAIPRRDPLTRPIDPTHRPDPSTKLIDETHRHDPSSRRS